MLILVTEEYGFAYQQWSYPGTLEELLQDWNQGKTPVTPPFTPGTPPQFEPMERDFKGTFERISFEQYCELEPQAEVFLRWCEDPNTLQIGETIYRDPIAMPQGNETDLSPQAKPCPSAKTMSKFFHGGSSPWIDAWVSHHIELCERCQAKWIVSREAFNICDCSSCKRE